MRVDGKKINFGRKSHGTTITVGQQNGALCQCNHHERPAHKPKYKSDHRSIYATGPRSPRVKLLMTVERSTGCRIHDCPCTRFRVKGQYQPEEAT